ncbi:uncharacterized protein PHACADRAFT_175094 [Phanerochaete carnosa HHB-10118-sp]|uniref:Uncharacterized protein n=1 Tax=Phanerochaete carnosa (strain HHB-10118-sp) TaxID=650164 RepID=K5WVT6_PHACS|nr:uncharacterized protein PHACADRAFT_175094 [Phanerochaete carnosa HHB-10118-sp]EKM54572.1 hypothetical protein PHACADRAFT_175094 [Phanerochaete carnosa HHB-10118-sp]
MPFSQGAYLYSNKSSQDPQATSRAQEFLTGTQETQKPLGCRVQTEDGAYPTSATNSQMLALLDDPALPFCSAPHLLDRPTMIGSIQQRSSPEWHRMGYGMAITDG